MNVVQLPLRQAPALSPGRIHVWFARPAELSLPSTSNGQGRTPDRLQQQFLLRLLLGAYLGVPGHEVRLRRTAAGKPLLAQPENALQFSLSHSGQWLSIALSRDLELGIDIETEARKARAEALSRRWFPVPEARHVEAAADPTLEFLRRWTAREAMIKTVGDTLAGSLGEIELDVAEADRPNKLPLHWPEPQRWCLRRPDAPNGIHACVACCGTPVAIESFLLNTDLENETGSS